MKAMAIVMVPILWVAVPFSARADLIPTNDNSFYYRVGGGQNIPAPPNRGAYSIPLKADNAVSMNYNCGVFDGQLSITNSLNGITNSFQNISQSVLGNATAAVMEFPMYILSRADPSLYNMLNNGLLGARQDLDVSTKTCQTMKNDLHRGQNPYENWASISMGDDWKYQMSLTGNSGLSSQSDSANDDINLVSKKIDEDSGSNGVPWVQGANTDRKGKYAGGRGQPAITVLRDTSIAGYNVILQENRAYDDKSAPHRSDDNARLVDTWSTPVSAADWITNVLGDEKVTTYNGGEKQSSPGVGLLPDTKTLTTTITEQLQDLVSSKEAISLEKLQAISAPGIMINSSVIIAVRQQTSVNQSILIEKLAQEVATAQVIDKALLARQILLEGGQVPDIYANHAAQASIHRGLERLKQEIDNLLFNVQVHKALVTDTVTQLLNQTQQQQTNHATIQPNEPFAPVLNQGAIPKNEEANSI
jgi:integrating conjugative element protein (TIGR03755 family)